MPLDLMFSIQFRTSSIKNIYCVGLKCNDFLQGLTDYNMYQLL